MMVSGDELGDWRITPTTDWESPAFQAIAVGIKGIMLPKCSKHATDAVKPPHMRTQPHSSICAPNAYNFVELLLRRMRFIGRKAGATLLQSARTAEAIGRPLNWVVVINYWQFGVTADTIFREHKAMREEWFARWSRYRPKNAPLPGLSRNGQPTYVYIHEVASGLAHTHWPVHLIDGNRDDFEKKLTKWLKKRYDIKDITSATLFIQPIHNAEGLKLYLAKGLDPHYARLWKIRPEDTGQVGFRKADASRNLGPSVWQPRKAAYKARPRKVA